MIVSEKKGSKITKIFYYDRKSDVINNVSHIKLAFTLIFNSIVSWVALSARNVNILAQFNLFSWKNLSIQHQR